jgi:hypothetical protein
MLRVIAIAIAISIGLLAEVVPAFAQGNYGSCEGYCSGDRCRGVRGSCMVKCVEACKQKHSKSK